MHAESHEGNVFAIKFYCKKDKRSDFKYSKITGRGDLGNIMITCLSAIPVILSSCPDASFAFAGAASVDLKSKKQERGVRTQRYIIYKYIASTVIGMETFEHFAYDGVSSYMLINRKNKNCVVTAEKFMTMFSETYLTLNEIR
ncbi:hypothetical protein MUK70_16920 [Dyadobacter chenwenxiniae]|uniref:hypothetical protein n=1 Tax=Dyadobacter chenwenxiniae TaxID=2906456 RepID=UPI001FD04595|nr:hypothetical protein [Dyadobacter chenwenxiniae]UON80750.1 hypothetical protein MUK70_16920 [Dyadobacter chenwenxiniae]